MSAEPWFNSRSSEPTEGLWQSPRHVEPVLERAPKWSREDWLDLASWASALAIAAIIAWANIPVKP